MKVFWNRKNQSEQLVPSHSFSGREILKNFVTEVELVDDRAKGLRRAPAEFIVGRGWKAKWDGDTLMSDILPLHGGGTATTVRLTHYGALVLEMPFSWSLTDDEILAFRANFSSWRGDL